MTTNDRPPPRPPTTPPSHADDAIERIRAAQREEDEQRVLRVRERYSPRWRAGQKLLEQAAASIREQAE